MRRIDSSSPHYRIEYAPRAWSQIGSLHAHEYRAVQDALRGVAEGTSDARQQADGAAAKHLALEGLLLTYAVDGETRTVRLLSLARVSLPQSP